MLGGKGQRNGTLPFFHDTTNRKWDGRVLPENSKSEWKSHRGPNFPTKCNSSMLRHKQHALVHVFISSHTGQIHKHKWAILKANSIH